jgi:hypothetical protein
MIEAVLLPSHHTVIICVAWLMAGSAFSVNTVTHHNIGHKPCNLWRYLPPRLCQHAGKCRQALVAPADKMRHAATAGKHHLLAGLLG